MDSSGDWFKVNVNDQHFVLRVKTSEDSFQIFLSDLASLWHDNQSAADILISCEKFNPLIDSTADVLIAHLKQILLSGSCYEIARNARDYSLTIASKLENLPFKWTFHLQLQDPSQFRKYIFLPMLLMVAETNSIVDDLYGVIRNKDKEIDDYKGSGAKVSRPYLETKEFVKENFLATRETKKATEIASLKDTAQTFCQQAAQKPYSDILEQILKQDLLSQKKDEKSNPAVEIQSSQSSQSSPTKREHSKRSKEAELSRAEALKKRLQEEEENAQAKKAKKDKRKLIL